MFRDHCHYDPGLFCHIINHTDTMKGFICQAWCHVQCCSVCDKSKTTAVSDRRFKVFLYCSEAQIYKNIVQFVSCVSPV